ncbi:MAG: hypothetical protein WCX83_00325 [Candidatus Cloacimonas sp.]
MKEVKYYMNAPCEVLRKISDDFSEVKVYPRFRDDLEGSQWCTECMVGNQGTPTRHTCEEYQEVINILEDIENSVLCIVENRLLANEPIEFKKIKMLDNDISKKEEILSSKSMAIVQLDKSIELKNKILNEIECRISKFEDIEKDNKENLELYSKKILEVKNQYVLSVPKNINLTKEDYKYLKERDLILTSLERGGVDNWEWYSESYPSEEELNNIGNS